MAAPLPFRRRNGRPSGPYRRPPARGAPWLPLVALIVVAGLLYLWSIYHPENMVESGVGNNITFRMCGRGVQRNCVVDGDTIHFDGDIIRLADINAPEVHEARCPEEAALGRQSTRRLLALLNAGPFVVMFSGGRDRDQYGRKLRIIQREGRSLGDTLIAEGLAHRWDGSKHSWCG